MPAPAAARPRRPADTRLAHAAPTRIGSPAAPRGCPLTPRGSWQRGGARRPRPYTSRASSRSSRPHSRRLRRRSGALAPRALPRRAGVGRARQMLGMHDERAPGQRRPDARLGRGAAAPPAGPVPASCMGTGGRSDPASLRCRSRSPLSQSPGSTRDAAVRRRRSLCVEAEAWLPRRRGSTAGIPNERSP